jgi:glycosyltransferase involved in cell wall biosynthesis
MSSLDPRLMRLAVLNQREGGGATAQARELLDQAASRGFDVAYHPSDSDSDSDALLSRLESFRPNIVHAHCFYNTWPPELLKRVAARWPVAFTVHDVYAVNQYGTECWECYRDSCFGCPALPLPKRLYSLYRGRSRRRHDRAWRGLDAHVVYPTEWMRRRVGGISLSGLPSSVIPYGIDTAAFAPNPRARAQLGIEAGVPLIVTVGSMYSAHDDRKGFQYLLESFARVVRKDLPAARLVIVGRTFGLHAPPGVEIKDGLSRDELRLWYAAADVFALPSLGDNAPLAVLEAMSSGLPVVATEVGGIPEQVAAGTTGILVRPREAESLGAALLGLLRDPARRTAMGAVGRGRAVDLFNRDRSWASHEALYRRLAAKRATTH